MTLPRAVLGCKGAGRGLRADEADKAGPLREPQARPNVLTYPNSVRLLVRPCDLLFTANGRGAAGACGADLLQREPETIAAAFPSDPADG